MAHDLGESLGVARKMPLGDVRCCKIFDVERTIARGCEPVVVLPNLIRRRHCEFDHVLQRSGDGPATGNVDCPAHPIRTFIAQQRQDPAAHRMADYVGLLDSEHIHEFAHVIDQVGE